MSHSIRGLFKVNCCIVYQSYNKRKPRWTRPAIGKFYISSKKLNQVEKEPSLLYLRIALDALLQVTMETEIGYYCSAVKKLQICSIIFIEKKI